MSETRTQTLLQGATERVVSHPGRSQYSARGRGASACGLAALNCARLVLQAERDDAVRGGDLLEHILSESFAEEVLAVCWQWEGAAHLDVEDIHAAPVFARALELKWSAYEQPGVEQFSDLLARLDQTTPDTAALIITRPPEILTLLKLPTSVFITFDSHPREKHPDGAAFIVHPSLTAASSYLASLLALDPRLLSDPSLSWQAQLLAHCAAHAFVARPCPAPAEEALVQASLEVLSLKAEVREWEGRVREGEREGERWGGEREALERRVEELEEENRRLRRAAAGGSSSGSSSGGPSSSGLGARPGPSSSSAPALPPARAPPIGKGKLVWNAVDELDEDDAVFATRVELAWREDPTDLGFVREQQRRFEEEDRQLRARYGVAGPSGSSRGDEDEAVLATRIGRAQVEETRSLSVAREQQLRYEEEDRQLRAQFDALQSVAPVTFACGVCLDEQPEDAVAAVERCGHQFCRSCVLSYLRTKLGEHRFPILCPTCAADRGTADPGTIDSTMAQTVGLTEDEFTRFTELELASFSVPLTCRRCRETVFVDKTEFTEARTIVCPLPGCNHVWCKACSRDIEIGGPPHSCDGSAELRHLMDQHGWKTCPGCQTHILKVDGCNHMTCIAPGCNTHFCYLCGEIIVQSVLRNEIGAALSTHYRRCPLIDVPPEVVRRR